MSEYHFVLVIEGDLLSERTIVSLFENGCSDATFSTVNGVSYGEFHREAANLTDAVLSATDDIESVRGLRVVDGYCPDDTELGRVDNGG